MASGAPVAAFAGTTAADAAGTGEATAVAAQQQQQCKSRRAIPQTLAHARLTAMIEARTQVAQLVACPSDVNPMCWQYEHLRLIVRQLNELVLLLSDQCNSTTCPQMKATEQWLFLCAAHRTPRECCAMDYSLHTMDNATSLLCNTKSFPSRNSIGESSAKHFQSIARRLYRIFAHANFHHNEIFNQYEETTQLCARFTQLCQHYNLMDQSMYIITHPQNG
eukprot:TRINITY_DN3765_c0_g1_i1.p1 TRINITY_DN3765_c0_g1~~TRINITY_DN3765_c0_g1_i1.p1  ORF type:complete len:233 (-),score=50.20 TRINITY_DN3765_c0_g1_i1:12-674(-)